MYLNCHSYFSFRYGTLSEKELLDTAQAHNIKSLTLTDINNTSACLNFIRLARTYHIKPIIGIDFRNDNEQLYIGIAQNNNGFKTLNDFLSEYKHSHKALPAETPELSDVFIIYPLASVQQLDKIKFKPNEYIGISIDDLNRFRFSKWKQHIDKCVVLQSFTFLNKKNYNTHRLLRAIDKNTLLSKLQLNEQANKKQTFVTPQVITTAYKDYPEIIKNTEHIMEQCHIHFDFGTNASSQNISNYTSSAQNDKQLLLRLCQQGLSYRYLTITTQIKERLEKEIDLIEKTNYISFFLTNWDIIRYARHKGYYHVGRGSGANSIVAYLLGITDVDPIELDLYFERFMNLYRSSPPDFDIDFSSEDRPDITRYIFNRFKRNNQVALLGAYSTFQRNGTIRELGKVFGLPNHEIELLNKTNTPKDELQQLVLRYANYIQDMPNHLTVHAAGILISQKPIHYFSATDMPPKGFPTVHFDMHIAEDVGLYKYDILGQRGLGKIKDTLQIIKYNQPHAPTIDLHNAKAIMRDKKVNDLISRADCMGCFYVESPAMRMLLKKLKVNNYLGLVAASSIIRPGVAKSGMMREYILRHKYPERRKEAHPVLAQIMPETYGIMVYQEDVIKVAHHFAGLSLSEADVLRRGMSGKYRSREEFQEVRNKFIDNCKAKGIEDKTINEVWHQVESFAGYAFAKGHSASYAVESYQSLYLKTYYPLEYMVAVLNNGGGFYSTQFYIHEAARLGAIIVAPCINKSYWHTSISGKHILLGFQHIIGVNKELVSNIIKSRLQKGNYHNLQDFIQRVVISNEQLDILIRIGAFDFTQIPKRKLLWEALFQLSKQAIIPEQFQLFENKTTAIKLPYFATTEQEQTFDQMELFGYALTKTFKLLEPKTLTTHRILAQDLVQYINKEITIIGQLVTVKRTSTSKGQQMQFGTFLDQQGCWIDTVHFPNTAYNYPFKGSGIYRVKGMVTNEFDFLTIEVNELEKIPYIADPRYVLDN